MSGANYYDQSQSFEDEPPRHHGQHHGERGGYGESNQEYRDTRYQGNDNYSGGDDFSSAAQHASEHHESSNGGFFQEALGFLNERKSQYANTDSYEVDEQHAVQSHQKLYGGGDPSNESHDSGSVGAGAAVQALKQFTSGGSSDGGFDKNKLIGMAMAQAGKLWDEKSSGGASMSGDKQSAINNAAEMAMKMYMKSSGGGSSGIGGLGNASGLMSLASKFLG
ncbi:hypothetical protein N7493_006837 [Penicillium malachiteum]|uniref:DUF7721 domain-containing protein n=1 Tax=Penicillium malachiteum TaxID=1324776 RepID=A0AAD6HJR1_9EURO|nr:hypothetical protein N7493_006837 [Penicillium malachiteum]